MEQYTDQEKIDFFDAHWKYIIRILNVLTKKKYIPVGSNLLEFLANWLEGNYFD